MAEALPPTQPDLSSEELAPPPSRKRHFKSEKKFTQADPALKNASMACDPERGVLPAFRRHLSVSTVFRRKLARKPTASKKEKDHFMEFIKKLSVPRVGKYSFIMLCANDGCSNSISSSPDSTWCKECRNKGFYKEFLYTLETKIEIEG
jgi:hypothetical protein